MRFLFLALLTLTACASTPSRVFYDAHGQPYTCADWDDERTCRYRTPPTRHLRPSPSGPSTGDIIL